MGVLEFLDVNDAKIEELWKRYLILRGLQSGSDPIPLGESPVDFRRKWEKYLYSQSPSGAVAATSAAGPAPAARTTAGATPSAARGAARAGRLRYASRYAKPACRDSGDGAAS